MWRPFFFIDDPNQIYAIFIRFFLPQTLSQAPRWIMGMLWGKDGEESDAGSEGTFDRAGWGWGGEGQHRVLSQLLLTPITRSIPEFPQGAVMFSGLHALYKWGIHRMGGPRWQGSHYWDEAVRLHMTVHVCNNDKAHVISVTARVHVKACW